MIRVLLVEDERACAEALDFALRRDGFEVRHVVTLAAAQRALPECDLVVLDLMLPDGSGFDLLHQLRSDGSRLPVLILSSREEEADRVAGLEGGADDYIIKPFSPREVVARIRAVLRRLPPDARSQGNPSSSPTGSGAHEVRPQGSDREARSTAGSDREARSTAGFEREARSAAVIEHDGLTLDPDTRRCTYHGGPAERAARSAAVIDSTQRSGAPSIDLTRTEFDLLLVLCGAPERVFSRQQLIDRIFGQGYTVSDRTIDAHIKALRRKLSAAGADPDLIETERGVGYRARAAQDQA